MLEQSTLMFSITLFENELKNGKVTFEYCSMKEMVADVLTKALPKERHYKLITMFGLETS